MLATVCGVVLALGLSGAPKESTLALPALESAVLRANPALVEARAMADAAHARIASARAPEDPMVDAMLAPASIGSSEVPTGYSVEVAQSLSFLGRSGAWHTRAAAEADESAAGARATVLDVLRETRAAFADYAVAFRTQALTREMRGAVDRMHDAALARYAAASTGASDALRAEAEIAMLDHAIDDADAERRAAVAALNALLHRAPDAPLPPPG